MAVEIKTKGKFEILTPIEELKRQLLMIEKAGRTCYQSEKGEVTEESATRFVKMLLSREHESVIEHSSMTVKFSDVSRGLTHELVRHRLTSFSQESTRYVDYDEKTVMILPPHRNLDKRLDLGYGRKMNPMEMFDEIELFYRVLRKDGWTSEDARQVLPNALESEIVATANFREWRHIFKMRTAKSAHWEIRSVMNELLEEVRTIVPVIVNDFEVIGKDKNGLDYYEIKRR